MNTKIQILRTPLIKESKNNKFITDDILLQELIEKFVRILEKNICRENLNLLYNNLGTLKVENKRIIYGLIVGIFNDSMITGQYYLDDNVISILPLSNRNILNNIVSINASEYVVNLYHELLHMATTIKGKNGRIAFSGFSQVRRNNSIGVAIDDGYTEMLLYRYFDFNKEYMSYKYEVFIVSLLEEIISKNKMIELYFTANLYDFVKELEKYNSSDNIIKFIHDLDSIYVLEDHTKKYKEDMIYYHNEISRFIVDSYRAKLKIDFHSNYIDFNEYNYKLNDCVEKLHIAFKSLELEDIKIRKR